MEKENIEWPKQEESIKLLKMSKGYNWEIKILGIDLDRLESIDKQLRERYGKESI